MLQESIVIFCNINGALHSIDQTVVYYSECTLGLPAGVPELKLD